MADMELAPLLNFRPSRWCERCIHGAAYQGSVARTRCPLIDAHNQNPALQVAEWQSGPDGSIWCMAFSPDVSEAVEAA